MTLPTNLINKVKSVESMSSSFTKTIIKQGVSTLTGNTLLFTKVDKTDTLREFANLYATFNLPVTLDQLTSYSGSTYSGTSLSGFSPNPIIVVEIPKNTYGEAIDGKTIHLKFPVTSGGTNVVVDVYSSFYQYTSIQTSNADTKIIDDNTFSQVFGNVAYLFCDNIAKPNRTTGLSWSTNGKFSSLQKELGTFEDKITPSNVDNFVGIAYLDKGFLVITNPTLVNGFVYSAATSNGQDGIPSGSTYTGGTNFTQVYFTGATSAVTTFNSIVTEYIQNVYCIALPEEFFTSENPTYAEAYGNTAITEGQPVYVTDLGLYNSDGELIAIAKTSEPLPKTRDGILTFSIQIKV
jgi:hypothetical protein